MNSPSTLVLPPPTPKLFDYPGAVTIVFVVVFSTAMVFVASRMDPTGGVLTISLMIVLAFIGMTVFVLFFTVPTDEITSAVIGGLVLAFGAIIAHWLGRKKDT
jgi:hypothetical protein